MTTTSPEPTTPAPSLLILRAPDETGHAALLQTIAAHLEAGRPVPCIAPRKGAANPWTDDAKGRDGAAQAREAAAACQTCPALTECRAYATTAPEAGAVWGGTTPTERAATRRRPHPRPGPRRRSSTVTEQHPEDLPNMTRPAQLAHWLVRAVLTGNEAAFTGVLDDVMREVDGNHDATRDLIIALTAAAGHGIVRAAEAQQHHQEQGADQ